MRNMITNRTVFFSQILLLIFSVNTLSAKNNRSPKSEYVKVIDLKCEYATNPIGMDVRFPQFSWRMVSGERGVLQTAYQIILADSQEKLHQEKEIIWNSGKIVSSKSVGVRYQGAELLCGQRYFWKVRVWGSDDKVCEWSEPAYFEMGLLDKKDWKAGWVGAGPVWKGNVNYFRKAISVKKKIKTARFYISGIGYYELFINGEKVGDHVLDPGTTSYDKRVLYTTYDVGEFLKKENVIGITVAPGWYGSEKLRGQLDITFTDGTNKSYFTSDSTGWSVSGGPIIQSSIFNGEIYDARRENAGWTPEAKIKRDSIREEKWENVISVDSPTGVMVAQKQEPIRIVERITPHIISEPTPHVYVLDAGQNMAGWASLRVKGEKGTIITLKFGETLYEDGTVNQENLRAAKAKDTYILRGGKEERWEPSFTYHGFRYIQIEGFPYRPKVGDIIVKAVRSDVQQVGRFSCSNALLNSIHEMVVNTEASNLHSIPTDCPQRDERMGWLNDMTVRIDQALYNFDLSRFYAKWIDDIGDTQNEEGSIADTAPFHWGYNPADPVSASYLLLALQSYNFYGNKLIIEEHYSGLKAWVDYLYSKTKNGIVDYSRWGDWSPPLEFSMEDSPNSRDTPGSLMSTGYLYYCSKIISDMADLLCEGDDADYYKELAKETATAFNKEYWNEQVGGYASNNQACNSFALFIGIVPKERISRVVKNLVEDVKMHDYHLTTGNLCTKYLLEMLTEHGHHEVAYRIATQKTYPSWGYMLANGATTLWERWEYATGSEMNSHNHPMMGSVDSWFYKYVLGIIPDINGPGFEKFIIHPYLFSDLKFAEGEFNSIKGVIKSAWRKESGYIILDVTIPENSVATLYIPTRELDSITESNKRIELVKGVEFLRGEGDYGVFSVGSGTYHFKSRWQ